MALFFLCLSLGVFAENVRVEQFELEEGWNAIYLSVEPTSPSPQTLFADLPIDIVAVFDEARNTGQFSSDPSVDMLRQLGWGVWYAPEREDAFLSDLSAINGNKGYLVHSTEAFTLSISGAVELHPAWWKVNAFNLKGYTLDSVSPPTFEQFFSGSSALAGQDVYRLVNGVWQRVTDPASAPMKSGEAFWVYCAGATSYPGPLSATADGRSGLVLEGQAVDLTLKNHTELPIEPSIQHVQSGADSVPLSIVVDAVDGEAARIQPIAVAMGGSAWSQPLPSLDGGAAIRIPFQARQAEITEPEVKTLLCVKTDLGTEIWVPVTGLREDLK